MADYKRYKKKVKKLGAKQVATPGEFTIIQKRLQQLRQRGGGKRYTTIRTSAIEKALREGGLTEKEISRLRGKK